MLARLLRAALAALAVVAFGAATGACQVDVGVVIRADADGGGRLTATAVLDADAVEHLGGETPAKRLALADLTEAGWRVEGPNPTPQQGLEITASHDFADGAEAEALLEDLAGENGPFQGFELRQTETFAKSTTQLSGTVDLRKGLGAFTDPDLREALAGPDGEALGVDDAQLTKRFGRPPAEAFTLDVTTDLPGQAAPATKRVPYGGTAVIEVATEQRNLRNLGSVVVAAIAALCMVVTLLLHARGKEALPAVT